MAIRTARPADKKIWDSYVNHPLQSWAWGEFREAMGLKVLRLIETREEKSVSCWQITIHRIPFTAISIGYFPKGPVVTEEMIHELSTIARQYNLIFIQLEPIQETSEKIHIPASLKPSHRPLFTKYTFVLDLTPSEESLLKALHPKTRYNIKVAQKHGVKIQEDNSDSAFSAYLLLEKETTQRQRFYAHDSNYHKTMWRVMRKAGIAHLFTATYQGNILAAWIIFRWKDTIYYPYGASSRQYRNVMAPNLMLWEVALWGKKQGARFFDLWGALGPNPNPNDPWLGFHRFKEGYNPTLVEFIGSYDLIINSLQYKAFCTMDNIRWSFLKFLRH